MTKIKQAKRENSRVQSAFDFKVPDGVRADLVSEGKYRAVHAIYLAAIGVGTVGRLRLIVPCVLQFG